MKITCDMRLRWVYAWVGATLCILYKMLVNERVGAPTLGEIAVFLTEGMSRMGPEDSTRQLDYVHC
jgi:hypothetical protein